MKYEIVIENLTKELDGNVVLNNINLKLPWRFFIFKEFVLSLNSEILIIS